MRKQYAHYSALAAALAMAALASASSILIDLEFRPSVQSVSVGDPVNIGVYAVGQGGATGHFNSLQAIVTWDPGFLQLAGTSLAGSIGLASSDFTAGDSWGLNEFNPPADGDGMWFGFAPITFPPTQLPATPAGSLLATLKFTALAETTGAWVAGLESFQKPGFPAAFTEIYDQTYNVFGDYRNAARVEIVPEPASVLLIALSVFSLRRR